MKRWTSLLLSAGSVVLLLLALSRWQEFSSSLRLGMLLGVAVVPLVVLPAILHGHEKRLAALEAARREES